MKICDRCEGKEDVQLDVCVEINRGLVDLPHGKATVDLCKYCRGALALEIKRFCEAIPKAVHPSMQRDDIQF